MHLGDAMISEGLRQDGYLTHTFAIIRIHATVTEENSKINRAIVIIIHLERSVCFIIIILVMRR